ncbi:IPT/TIG domain protein [compost metagenome]
MAFLRRSVRPVAIALTLSSMAGCAAPVPGAVSFEPAAPQTPVAEAPAAAAPTAAPAQVPAATALAIAGAVTFRGEPVAASPLAVFDARTGARVAADRLTGSNKTDSHGRFSLELAGAATGEVYRLVAAASPTAGLAATFLVTASGIRVLAARTAGGYHVAQTPGGMAVNETSTTLSIAAGGALQLGAQLTPTATQPGVEGLFTDLGNAGPQVTSTLNAQPSSANRIVEMIDPGTGWVRTGGDDSLSAVMPRDAVETATRNVLDNFNSQANEPTNRVPGLNARPVALPGLGVSAGWGANQTVKVTRSDGSNTGITTPGALRAPAGSSGSGSAVPTPVVTALSVTSGLMVVPTPLVITGSGFTGATAVHFGALPAQTFQVLSDTQISATAPASMAQGTVGVSVTTPAGVHTLGNAFQYSVPNILPGPGTNPPVVNPPVVTPPVIPPFTFPTITVTSLGTTSGSTAGGTTVVINGSIFNSTGMVVSFGGTAVPYTFTDGTRISIITPPHAAGTVDVSVSFFIFTPGTLAGAFTYVEPPAVL